MSDPVIEVRGLQMSYGTVHAVRGIDLTVERGEVFALLGPNGAGKTSTVEILEGYRHRTGGDVRVLGVDPEQGGAAWRARLGVVLQDSAINRFLTVAEIIDQYRGYYPDPMPLDEVIELVGLSEKRNERVRRLSGGQQRRLDVAIGLAGNPELLFLDEPTTGFDPAARRGAWEMVRNLQARGRTILLTTHYLDEAQQLADRVAVIVGGRIVAEGPPSTLAGREQLQTTVSFSLPPDTPPPVLVGEPARDGDVWTVRTSEPTRLLHDLTGWALSAGVELGDLEVRRPSLEDVYLLLTDAAHTATATGEQP